MHQRARSALILPLTVTAALLTSIAALGQSQTVDDIVAKNLESRGGVEKWRSIQSMKVTGTIESGGRTINLTAFSKRPNLSRQEMSFQGQQMVQAFDGTHVWVVSPGAGDSKAQEVKGAQADLARAQAEFDSVLFDYKEKGHKVELVGRETDEGHDVYHLRVTRKGGDVQHYYLDADTGIERKITSTLKGPSGETATATIEFGDFRDVNGMKAPFTIKNSLDGHLISQVTVSKVEFNVPIDDSLFQMPATAR
jgi:outer membrane lipoprotein-sorting protein